MFVRCHHRCIHHIHDSHATGVCPFYRVATAAPFETNPYNRFDIAALPLHASEGRCAESEPLVLIRRAGDWPYGVTIRLRVGFDGREIASAMLTTDITTLWPERYCEWRSSTRAAGECVIHDNQLTPARRAARAIRSYVGRHSSLFWATLFVVAFGAYFWRQHHELQRVADAVAGADLRWISLLAAVYVVTLSAAAASYRIILRRLGHQTPLSTCARIHLQRHVVGTITPVGGPASVYVLIRALASRGVSTNDALLVTTIRSAVGYTAFVIILIPALALQRPSALVLGASFALVVLLGIVLLALSLLLRRDELSPNVQRRLPSSVSRFLTEASTHGVRARDLATPLGLSLTQNLAGAASVYISLRALGIESALGMALVGYAIGNLFTIIAPVFQGLGVVELTMALALHQQGVPMTAAVAATLLYRLADVWFPLVLGGSVHAAGMTAVRRTASRFGPALAMSAGAFALALGAYVMTWPNLSARELALTSNHAIALIATVTAGAWLAGLVSSTWRRRMPQQLVPVTTLAISVPAMTLLIVGFDISVPF